MEHYGKNVQQQYHHDHQHYVWAYSEKIAGIPAEWDFEKNVLICSTDAQQCKNNKFNHHDSNINTATNQKKIAHTHTRLWHIKLNKIWKKEIA